jgi:hypothetical protein
MKRSNIYLGLTTCVLAIVAGIATAKAHRSESKSAGYYTNFSHSACTLLGGGYFFTVGDDTRGSGFTHKATNGLGNTLHSTNIFVGGFCAGRPLYTRFFD